MLWGLLNQEAHYRTGLCKQQWVEHCEGTSSLEEEEEESVYLVWTPQVAVTLVATGIAGRQGC